MANKHNLNGMRARRVTADIITYIFLSIMCIVWLMPFFWVIMQSFRDGKGQFISTFLPEKYTLNNYIALFKEADVINFPRMFLNTLVLACCTCVLSTFFVLSVAYCTSRLKWKLRKPYMNMAMIINLFPGFMSMMAVYFILKALGMTEGDKIYISLVICFSAGAGTGFFVMKGYMDTIPKALDEAAMIDGCSKYRIFSQVVLPLLGPSIITTIVISFYWIWDDYMGPLLYLTKPALYTVSLGIKNFADAQGTNFGPMFAMSTLSLIPVFLLFLFFNRYLMDGVTAGSVKG